MNLEPGTASFAMGFPVGHTRVDASSPAGYEEESDFLSYAPEGGSVHETESEIRWGFATYGSLGAMFDSDADDTVGVDHDFYSSTMLVNVAVMVAMPVGDRLSVGAALAGIYGQSHLRYFQNAPFAYTVRGPGVQAIFGLRYRLTDEIALGLGFRTPGKVWAEGDDGAKGPHQDVSLGLDLPAQVFLGINANVTSRFDVGLAGRWTDASSFGGSEFRFEDTPEANIPFIRSASDEWRISAGAGYKLTDRLTVRGGVGYADAMVPDEWVSPLIIDSAEWKIGAGLSWEVAGWFVDFTAGGCPGGTRDISDSEAAIYPGRYTVGGEIYMLGVRTTI